MMSIAGTSSIFLTAFTLLLSLPLTCLGQQKRARIDLKLVDGICGQYAAFETTKLLQPPFKKSVSSLYGEVRWQSCELKLQTALQALDCFTVFKMTSENEKEE
ncbi:unnamed protein product [Allacma fusca]|uniref:Secreted protein n=1 Tax=Allacma fusca TaxID=39272 RepID=A0A8J2KEC0_9HEXA|nr:unnamed protein product [Allacma fusca]